MAIYLVIITTFKNILVSELRVFHYEVTVVGAIYMNDTVLQLANYSIREY